jgi:uncharacterized membrane protein
LGRLGDAKTLGGIGSILQIIPFLSIIGYILTLIAVKYISDEVQDPSIFTDMVYAVLAGIVGAGVGAFILIFSFVLAAPFAPPTGGASFGLAAFFGILSFLAVAWIALILSAIFIRRAFERIATRLNVGAFRTAGTLYFIGALLTIVLVGLIIIFVAFIVQIVAFFSIQEGALGQPAPIAGMAPAAQPATKFCPTCGTQMPAASTFCPKCGARQPV